MAFECADRGAKLAITSRRFNRLKKVAADIGYAFPDPPAPLVIPCDVTDKEKVGGLIKSRVDHLGGIDILINNACIGVDGDTERTTLYDFHLVME